MQLCKGKAPFLPSQKSVVGFGARAPSISTFSHTICMNLNKSLNLCLCFLICKRRQQYLPHKRVVVNFK